jgi:hypothetical protein
VVGAHLQEQMTYFFKWFTRLETDSWTEAILNLFSHPFFYILFDIYAHVCGDTVLYTACLDLAIGLVR